MPKKSIQKFFSNAGLHIRIPRGIATGKLWALRAALVTISCYGVWSFVKLGLLPYLFFQTQFAFADFSSPLSLISVRYASVAVLLGVIGHFLRMVLACA